MGVFDWVQVGRIIRDTDFTLAWILGWMRRNVGRESTYLPLPQSCSMYSIGAWLGIFLYYGVFDGSGWYEM